MRYLAYLGFFLASCGAETSAPACDYTVKLTDDAALIEIFSDEPVSMLCVYTPGYDEQCVYVSREAYDCITISREAFRTRVSVNSCETWLW